MGKPRSKKDNKEQSERFVKKAREIEADESGEAFERALRKITLPKVKPPSKESEGE